MNFMISGWVSHKQAKTRHFATVKGSKGDSCVPDPDPSGQRSDSFTPHSKPSKTNVVRLGHAFGVGQDLSNEMKNIDPAFWLRSLRHMSHRNQTSKNLQFLPPPNNLPFKL